MIDGLGPFQVSENTYNGTNCIESKFSTRYSGHCVIRRNGKTLDVHRVAYQEFVGPIPDGFVIHHKCRNKRCFNVYHLEPKELRLHSIEHNRGEENPNSKLKEDQVLEIRKIYESENPPSYSRTAKDFGVTKDLICKIVIRKIWTHI